MGKPDQSDLERRLSILETQFDQLEAWLKENFSKSYAREFPSESQEPAGEHPDHPSL